MYQKHELFKNFKEKRQKGAQPDWFDLYIYMTHVTQPARPAHLATSSSNPLPHTLKPSKALPFRM